MAKGRKSSPEVASVAGKVLQAESSSEVARTLAASVVSQAARKKKKKK